MKKDLLFLAGLMIVIIGLLIFGSSSGSIPGVRKSLEATTTQVKIKGQVFKVEVAKTPDQHAKGLSERDSLPENAGMLFVFDKPDQYQFWMKNTKIPLDIIWINQDKKIVDFYQNAQPEPAVPDSQLRRYGPSTSALYVLELAAGTVGKYQITTSELVDFNL